MEPIAGWLEVGTAIWPGATWPSGRQYDARVRGDRVEVVIDTGAGLERYDIEATKAGRRVEVFTSRGQVEVNEVTRTGQTVRTARFMASRVVALVEHPSEEPDEDRPRGGRRASRFSRRAQSRAAC